VGAENAIREEIINAINSKLEATILGSAAGSSTQPAGIFYTATTLDAITNFADLCDMESDVEDANVYGEMKYIMSPKAKAALRGMAKTGTANGLVYENGEVDGTPALSTSNVKNYNIAYGDWSNYIIAQWGNIDLTVDNVSLAANGQIRLVVNAYFDAKPLRAEAIKVATIDVD
jgi:HK97 family phage major capsid protein